MGRQQYLIVGGSAAGMAAAEAIARFDPGGQVCVLSEETDAPYFRPMIPLIVSRQRDPGQIGLQGHGPYRSGNAEVRLGARVRSLDTRRRAVVTQAQETFSYQRLLIATGSRPHIPENIQGTTHAGVFALRTLEDARRAGQRAETATHAVMLGGGLLNLKFAFALLERKLAVTLVVRSPEVLSQLMEPGDARLIRQALDRAGLWTVTGASATRIVADENGVCGVVLDNGRELACQMVCIGKGVRPNCDWIDDNRVHIDSGVKVDAFTRTGAPDVFAAGDAAVTFDPISGNPVVTGLWTNAVEMGRCAGANMAGRPTAYGGTFGILNATQVARMPFVSMGRVHTAGTDLEVHVRRGCKAYRKLVFSSDGQRMVGAVFVGDIARAGLYRSLILGRRRLNGIRKAVMDHTLHYGHLLQATG